MTRDRVLAWLNETGFPLEMRAAKAFRSAGFDVQQSSTYLDPQSEKGREIDVVAEDPDPWGFINLSIVAECKSSPNPWVVLTSEDALPAYSHVRALGVLSDQVRITLQRDSVDRLNVKKFFHKGTRCGYGLRQAFAKGTDPAYGAAINLLSACQGVTDRRFFGNWPNYSACVPVLVVDSPLFECELLPDGGLTFTEVESSQFLFSAHFPKNHVMCLVHVVTAPHLDRTATWAKSLVDALRKDLEPDQEKFFAEATKAAQQRDN